MTIGEKLKYILLITNMSAKELSQNSGVSLNTIYGITCRNRKKITPEIDEKLSNALNLPCLLSSLDDNALKNISLSHDSPAQSEPPNRNLEVNYSVSRYSGSDPLVAEEITYSSRIQSEQAQRALKYYKMESEYYNYFHALNEEGQEKTLDYMKTLSTHPKYKAAPKEKDKTLDSK